jgi:hypothetical protein
VKFKAKRERINDGPLPIDRQLAVFAPLRMETIASLLGYRTSSTIRALRCRGSTIPAERLHFAARRLEALAARARELALVAPVHDPRRIIAPELYADLGLVLSDEEAKPR